MYKKIIEYTDYNGATRKEPFYFNLDEAELMRYSFSKDGGYQAYLSRLIATGKQAETYQIFEKFICDSYGVKSDDGKRFIKNEEVLNEFKESRAYSAFIMELISKEGAANEFIEGIMPKALIAQIHSKLTDNDLQGQIDDIITGKEAEAEDTVISDSTKGE